MSSKKKGNRGENAWANWMQTQGFSVYRNSSSGSNANKSDAHNDLGMNFEIKTVKKLNLQRAWKQSCNDAFMSHAVPTVIIHFDGMPKDNWLVVMNNWDWLELVKKNMGLEGATTGIQKQDIWKLKDLLQRLKSTIKILEKYE